MLNGVSQIAQLVKNPPAMQETWLWSIGWEDPLEEGMNPHGQRSLKGYSPWGHKESDVTEQLSTNTHAYNILLSEQSKL